MSNDPAGVGEAVRRRITLAVILVLLGLPTLLMAYKVTVLGYGLRLIVPEERYFVNVTMSFEGTGEGVDVRVALPIETPRQHVVGEWVDSPGFLFQVAQQRGNRFGKWSHPKLGGAASVVYTFSATARQERYVIADELTIPEAYPEDLLPDLEATELIQSTDPAVMAKLRELVPAGERRIGRTLRALFDFVKDGLKPLPFRGTTDALTALRLGEASCGGKSRLLAALTRAAGIPTRLVGGILLEPGSKRTSHLWVEAWVFAHWVPFDALNNHFSELPADYLVVYYGEEPLFTHTRDINFQYAFKMKKRLATPQDVLDALREHPLNAINVWQTFRQAHISLELLKIILMIPFGGLIVVLFRNFIGLRTFGTFLPALLAVSFRETGILWGTAVLLTVLAVGIAVVRSLRGLHLLHTPRLVVVLVATVCVLLGYAMLGVQLGQLEAAGSVLFPMVVLSLTVERFFIYVEESGWRETLLVLLQTMIAVLGCYAVMNLFVLQAVLLAFPELLMAVAAAAIAVGSYAGLRLSELFRFAPLAAAIAMEPGSAVGGATGLDTGNADREAAP
ncbi:MAG: UUP1 family membrane protein [Candidatus Schekmanbacteria bacterium]|nr:UUP1 family membrane protein [Candidatus Schekmanbacteria bacterium]